ncbi:Uncharacterised protein [Brevibacterium casei]|uniref:Uncharacterized protein n=1 Tax=Brevibacterium casei TaxID=33889 RepID=A0A269ZF17_9MICO|nr:hypothetical protein B8X04_07535 [Brevibacterium casei]VEW11990.1 Uncharacterised protein [Brevibacterium casei]
MNAAERTSATAPADLTNPTDGPGLASAGGGLPVVVMPVLIRAPHSKSSGSLIRSYGRGKGLSIAAPCNNMPGQLPVSPSLHRVTPQDHLGSHLGVNRGSFKAPHAPSDVLDGGRRG